MNIVYFYFFFYIKNVGSEFLPVNCTHSRTVLGPCYAFSMWRNNKNLFIYKCVRILSKNLCVTAVVARSVHKKRAAVSIKHKCSSVQQIAIIVMLILEIITQTNI
jgi:hypothetical protein